MEEYRMSAAELLAAWRDATLGAELAARLAAEAAAAAEEADIDALGNECLVEFAEAAARAAEAAAEDARRCAQRARSRATVSSDRVAQAQQAAHAADAREVDAGDRYHSSRPVHDGARPPD
jgi:hypothetical protein